MLSLTPVTALAALTGISRRLTETELNRHLTPKRLSPQG